MRAVLLLVLCGFGGAMVFQSSFEDCVCSGYKPCQHAYGTACFSLVEKTGGSRECPADTSHCDCPCTGVSPCHNVGGILLAGQTTPQVCLDTVVMFGQAVCPAGSIHCRYTPPLNKHAPTPVPPPGPTDCRCTLQKPCQSLDLLKKCEASLGNEGECPIDHLQCIPEGLTPQCVCGGGRPCQFLHSTECFEKGLDDNDVLQCPERTKECDCPCPHISDDGPCYERVGDQDFCFQLKPFFKTADYGIVGDVNVCDQGKVHCQQSDPLPQDHVYQRLSDFPSSIPSVGNAIAVHASNAASTTGLLYMDDLHAHKFVTSPCTVAEWSEWEMCSVQCGGGQRKREAIRYSHTSSLLCKLVEKQECNMRACAPRDCTFRFPDDWSECSMSCGGGWEEKKPRVIVQAKDGGKECASTQRRQCNTQLCVKKLSCDCNPISPVLGSPFLTPPLTMEDMQCRRDEQGMMRVHHSANQHFYKCAYTHMQGCHCCLCKTQLCVQSAWGSWGTCNPTTGLRKRSRTVAGKAPEDEHCPRQIETGRCGHAYSMP